MKLNLPIAAVLSIAASSSLWASPPGKNITGKVLLMHGSKEAKNVVAEHTILKRNGPPGKGSVRHLSNNR